MKIKLDAARATEAKAIVAQAFRNGPIEDLHAGKVCPTCSANPDYSRISDAEMKVLMKAAVTHGIQNALDARSRCGRLRQSVSSCAPLFAALG